MIATMLLGDATAASCMYLPRGGDQAKSVLKPEHTRQMQRGVFAKAQARVGGDDRRIDLARGDGGRDSTPRRSRTIAGWLMSVWFRRSSGPPNATALRSKPTMSFAASNARRACSRARKVFTHADDLCALAGTEDEGGGRHCLIAARVFNPCS